MKRLAWSLPALLCLSTQLQAAPTAQMLQDINPNGSSNPWFLAAVNGTAYFSADDGVHGQELWSTTGSYTQMVADIVPGAAGSWPSSALKVNRPYSDVGDLYFVTNNDAVGNFQLWTSDGTAAGTTMVAPLAPHSDYVSLAGAAGSLYFPADDGTGTKVELWQAVRTSSGEIQTSPVKDSHTGATVSNPAGLTEVNGTAYFFAGGDDGNSSELWLWKANDTEGAVPVQDLGNAAFYLAEVAYIADVGGTAYFTTYSYPGVALWKSDGTASGTAQLARFPAAPTSYGYRPVVFTTFKDAAYFIIDDGISGIALWKSDGTAGGTVPVKTLGPTGAWHPYSLAELNGALYFAADDGVHGLELWTSDGTADGTVMMRDINPGAGGSSPSDLTVVNGKLYFSADDGAHGREPWSSDGTAAGTALVQDINPNGDSIQVGRGFTALDDYHLIFAADDGVHGLEPWLLTVPNNHGILQFTQTEYVGDQVTVTVTRSNGSEGAISVNYDEYFDGSSWISGGLTWADGDAAPKSFTAYGLFDCYQGEANINLSNPTGGAQLGTLSTAGVSPDSGTGGCGY